MHDFTNRSGATEQTRYVRRQPDRLRNQPFDFEIVDREWKERIRFLKFALLTLILWGLSVWQLVS